jgi:hypothetical protein
LDYFLTDGVPGVCDVGPEVGGGVGCRGVTSGKPLASGLLGRLEYVGVTGDWCACVVDIMLVHNRARCNFVCYTTHDYGFLRATYWASIGFGARISIAIHAST